MARKPVRHKAERDSTNQARWLRMKVAQEYGDDFNPVIEMIRIAQKRTIGRRDRERFDQLNAIAQYIQPKLSAVKLDLPGSESGDGELIVKWKSR